MSDKTVVRVAGKSASTPRKTAAAEAKPAVPIAKKPFSMSYDGTTTAEHVQYMIARGAR